MDDLDVQFGERSERELASFARVTQRCVVATVGLGLFAHSSVSLLLLFGACHRILGRKPPMQ